MRIEIMNWEKYNPRAKAKSGWSWWRFQNDFFEDEDFYELPGHYLLTWVYLCCRRSRSDSEGGVSINIKQVADKSRTTPDEVKKALRVFESLNKLKILEDDVSRTDAYADVRIRTHPYPTDETDETDETRRLTDTPPASVQINDPLAEPKKSKKLSKSPSEGVRVWNAYRGAYMARYQQEPVRNAKVNAQCDQLVGRLGLEAAIKVVDFYLTHSNRYYVQQVHALGLCLKDAEGLHTQMLANYRVSSSEAHGQDKQQNNLQNFQSIAEKLKAEGVL